jgi:hypothetical protein
VLVVEHGEHRRRVAVLAHSTDSHSPHLNAARESQILKVKPVGRRTLGMSLAGETRAAVDDHPFLRRALRAGVVNHAAAARFLDVDGDEDAVAAAVRRYADDLPALERRDASARVSMSSGVSKAGTDGAAGEGDGLLAVGDAAFARDGGSLTALVAAGDGLDSRALAYSLERLHAAGIEPVAAGVADGLAVVVERRDGADALRVVEDALSSVPDRSQ